MRNLIVVGVAAMIVLAIGGAVLSGGVRVAGAPSGGGDADHETVAAPIERIDVLVRESSPPQVTLKVTAGLPSGCARRHSHQLSRAGDTFTVTVLNSMPRGDPVCTMIYGTYDLEIDLGSTLGPGTYTVRVNDQIRTFRV
jgi:hypothetical protein